MLKKSSLFFFIFIGSLFILNAQPGIKGARSWQSKSVLSEGTWYKIGFRETGIYKLDYDFLSTLGIKPSQLSTKTIKIFGQGGGPLPELNKTSRTDDLKEQAIWIEDGNDDRFDKGDYILFYGKGPHQWIGDSLNKTFNHFTHPYDNTSYYFLTFGGADGKRIQMQTAINANADFQTQQSDFYTYHEEDKINLIKTGREWFGEEFDKILKYSFSSYVPDIETTEPVTFRTEFVGRSFTGSSYTVDINGNQLVSLYIPPVTNALESYFVYPPKLQEVKFNSNTGNFDIDYSFSRNSDNATGWLNYYEIIARRKLNFSDGQFSFRDIRNLGAGKVLQFNFTGNSNCKIWDVSNAGTPEEIIFNSTGSGLSFKTDASKLREFVIHNGAYMTPAFGYQISNQNLHGVGQYSMVILTNGDFLEQANQLKTFHEQYNKFNVLVVTPDKIYNEFSSGAQDPTAIKDFMKMLFDRSKGVNDAPRFLLIVGDASYDYKDRIQNNTNKVPTYETENSFSPIGSFVSDDYYAYLGDDEGDYLGDADMDISVGRLPVNSTTEANNAVQKILNYVKPLGFGSWRNQICFVADDKDGNQHLSQTESLFKIVNGTDSVVNVNKIYFDSYKRTLQNGSFAYPDVNKNISQQLRDGALVVTYAGHGGETGWAHEHVLGMDDINGWNNKNKLPLFVTATCEFTKFDDPNISTGGERVFLNPNGGGIALITTSRLVFGSGNQVLTENLFRNNLFNGGHTNNKTLGECYQMAKNLTNDMNSQRFVLIGDPAIYLAFPEYTVVTTSMNGKPTALVTDTIKALSFNSFEGEIHDLNGLVTDFNGELEVTVYDKPVTYKTLGNDPESVVVPFTLQNSIIYKGRVSVIDGKFNFSFYAPKDISYTFGKGKISYYAASKVHDATGTFNNFIVGGSENPINVPKDNEGPRVKLYMNDTLFINGGTTNENPTFLALVNDAYGINTVASGIGHDITAIIDGNQEQILVLNEFFSSLLNDSKSGWVTYPLSSIQEGTHTITFKVWDIFNNSSEASLDFVVVNANKPKITSVINYPNPFKDETHFEVTHNQFGNSIDLWFEVLDVSGRSLFVKHFETVQDGNRFTWTWDGNTENGQHVDSGLYFYRFILRSEANEEVKTGKVVVY